LGDISKNFCFSLGERLFLVKNSQKFPQVFKILKNSHKKRYKYSLFCPKPF